MAAAIALAEGFDVPAFGQERLHHAVELPGRQLQVVFAAVIRGSEEAKLAQPVQGSLFSSLVPGKNPLVGKDEEIEFAGVFVFVGLEPDTQFVRGVVDLDARGFVRTGPTLETNQPGVFAAGDARLGSSKQLVSAAGEGATAALMIRHYLQGLRAVPAAGVEQPELAALTRNL